jgi:hypothetical protein
MQKGNKFDGKAIKNVVEANLENMEKPEITDIIELIRPFCRWDESDLIERELKSKARYIMRSFRDENGVRTYYSGNDGVYINIEKTTDLSDLDKVNIQLEKKYSGLSAALKKVRARVTGIISKYSDRYFTK